MNTAIRTALVLAALCAGARAAEMSLGPVTPAAAVKGQNQTSPDVAFGKDGYLAVWQRSRNEAGRIECARLDAGGKPLDAKPIVIAPDAEWQEAPRVAFGAGVYLVVWQDLRSGKEFDVFAARVSPEGKVLDPGGFPVSGTPEDSSRQPCVTFDGKGFIVIWSQLAAGNKGNYRLTASRVGPDGKASAPQSLDIKYRGVPFCKNLQDLVEPDAAVCGNRLLVAAGGGDFVGLFNTADLAPVGSPEGWRPKDPKNETRQMWRGVTRRPGVAASDKELWGCVWNGWTDGKSLADLFRVSSDFKVSEVESFWLNGLIAPALAWDGENMLLVRQRWSAEGKTYGRNSHLCVRRVTPDGKPVEAADLDVAGTTTAQLNTMPRLASDGKGHVLMIWEQHPTASDGNVVAATRLITTK